MFDWMGEGGEVMHKVKNWIVAHPQLFSLTVGLIVIFAFGAVCGKGPCHYLCEFM